MRSSRRSSSTGPKTFDQMNFQYEKTERTPRSGGRTRRRKLNPIRRARKCRKVLRQIAFVARRDTYRELAQLYRVYRAFCKRPAAYAQFVLDPFFDCYKLKRPKGDDAPEDMMMALTRYAYNAKKMGKGRYQAARRAASKLIRYAEDDVPAAEVFGLLNKKADRNFIYNLGRPQQEKSRPVEATPTPHSTRDEPSTRVVLSLPNDVARRLLKHGCAELTVLFQITPESVD
jgi:hypothetical protein